MSFVLDLLQKNNKRLDDRDFLVSRPYEISCVDGIYMISAQNVRITLNHRVTISKPHSDTPHLGILKIFVANPQYTRGSNDRAVSSFLKAIFVRHRAVDLESLCLIYNELCLRLEFSIVIIESDGGVLNFCALLLVHVLSNISLYDDLFVNPIFKPKLDDLLQDGDIFKNEKVIFNYIPTFYVFALVSGKILLDPVSAEMCDADSFFVVVMNGKNLVVFEKSGVECDLADILRVRNFCAYNEKVSYEKIDEKHT